MSCTLYGVTHNGIICKRTYFDEKFEARNYIEQSVLKTVKYVVSEMHWAKIISINADFINGRVDYEYMIKGDDAKQIKRETDQYEIVEFKSN